MDIAKLKLLLDESAFGLSDLARALEFLGLTILNLQVHGLLISLGSTWVESKLNILCRISGHLISHRFRLEL